jgi:hypothetical protein
MSASTRRFEPCCELLERLGMTPGEIWRRIHLLNRSRLERELNDEHHVTLDPDLNAHDCRGTRDRGTVATRPADRSDHRAQM